MFTTMKDMTTKGMIDRVMTNMGMTITVLTEKDLMKMGMMSRVLIKKVSTVKVYTKMEHYMMRKVTT